MEKLNGLRCRECGRRYPATPVHVCEFCFGPLEVDYRYDTLQTIVTRESIAAGPPSMWRYKDLLPVEGDVAVGHHVGFTPLIRAQNLADELGCREVWVKNDSVCHPSWSFKDRVVAVAVTKAKEFGYDTVACASTGNLANSVAAHAAEGRLKSYIFIPADLEQGKVLATLVYNPTLVAVHGTYDEVNRLCSEIADKYRWAFVNVNFRPYYSEGSKSYGFEIIEQLGWRAPEHIIVPCAGGSLITKIWKGIKELKTLGLIAGPVTTKMHAA
ncbi:MAG: threonine synthase, partial [Candidatus Rokubacteria bacterium 13_1_20CM_2_69_58]